MAFFLRKLLADALMPLPVLLLLGFIGWALWLRGKRRRLARVLVAASLFGIAVLSVDPVARPLIGAVEGSAQAFPGDSVDFVVVLGHGHDSDPRLPLSAWAEPEALYRIVEGVRIAHEQPWAMLVLSGYGGRDRRSHAEVAAEVARALGVEPTRMWLEATATTTAEEAEKLEGRLTGARFALVTSASHMPRAAALFRGRGLTPVEAPTGHLARAPGRPFAVLGLVPDEANLDRVHVAWYEILSRALARLSGVS